MFNDIKYFVSPSSKENEASYTSFQNYIIVDSDKSKGIKINKRDLNDNEYINKLKNFSLDVLV